MRFRKKIDPNICDRTKPKNKLKPNGGKSGSIFLCFFRAPRQY